LGKLHSQSEDSLSFRLAIVPAVYVSKPEDIKEIFRRPQIFTKGGLLVDQARKILGNGLPMSNGTFWARQRRILSNSFRAQMLQSYIEIFDQRTNQAVNRWIEKSTSKPYDIFQDLARTTMDVSVEALFGASVSSDEQETILASIDHSLIEINRRLAKGDIFPLWLPTKANAKLRRAIGEFRDIILRVIEEKNRQADPDYTIINLLLATKDEETGQYMKPEQIIDEIRSFFVAGSETSASTMAWTVYELARNPEVYQKVEEEVNEWWTKGGEMNIHGLMELPLVNAVVKEAMRLYPAVWIQTRAVSETTKLGQYSIPKGASVFFSAYWSQRDPNIWNDPNNFYPERFLNGLTTEQEMAYFPFSTGPRKCIGYRFAKLEMVTLLVNLVRKATISLPEGFEPGFNVQGSLIPEKGILMHVREK